MNNLKSGQLNIKRLTAMLLAVMMAVIGLASSALTVSAKKADDGVANGAYEITNYDFDAVVSKDHSYAITENITVNIPDEVQQIQIMIPSGNFRVTGLETDGVNYLYEKDSASDFVTIVDKNQLSKGQHTYTLTYVVREFADRDETKDILYFDVLEPSWTQPITELAIKVQFPSDFPWDDMQYYAGQFGVQNVNTKLDYRADKNNRTVSITGNRIPENFGITLKADLPDSYWEGMLDGSWAMNFMTLLAAAVVVMLLVLWLIGGRDPKIAAVKQVHPVEGITPLEMGYIFIGRVRVRDVIAMIIYLGTKGCLRISEYAPKKYNIIRTADPTGEEKFIRNAYDILFEDIPQERGVDMADLGKRLRRIKKVIGEDVAAGFASSEMLAYTPLSRSFRIAGVILMGFMVGVVSQLKYSYVYTSANILEAVITGMLTAAMLVVLCREFDRFYYTDKRRFSIRFILAAIAFIGIPIYVMVSNVAMTGKWLPAAVTLVLMLIGTYLVLFMRARAKGNAALVSRFRQLRKFIYDPNPKDIAENAFRDINYYYEILPYAMLFDQLESWAYRFHTLDVPAPEWYSDDSEGSAFTNLRTETTVVDYAKDISAFARTIENNYHAEGRKHK